MLSVPKVRAGESGFAALNVLRAWAIVIVVLVHAIIPYMPAPVPDILWGIRDRSTHPSYGVLFWALVLLPMQVFFFSAGFFSAKKLEILGTRAFIGDRARRILVPFLAGTLVILPLVYYAWSYGWYISGRCTLREIILAEFIDPEISRNLAGPAHLWFLEYLFLISAAYPFLGKWKPSQRVLKVVAAFPLLLAVPTAVILCINHDAAVARFNTFWPLLSRLVNFGYFFLAGALIRRFPYLLKKIQEKGVLCFAVSAPALAVTILFIDRSLAGEISLADRSVLACATALYVWSVLLGGIALALRWVKRQSAPSRYLSDASFSIYLVHLPVVGFIQDALYGFALPAWVKLFVAFFGTLFLTLLFHQTTRIPDYLLGLRRLGNFSHVQKITLSFALTVFIFTVGATYQFLYNLEKARYTEIISGYYRKYFDREPDPVGVNHWTMIALNKWGLERVEKVIFIEGAGKRAPQ